MTAPFSTLQHPLALVIYTHRKEQERDDGLPQVDDVFRRHLQDKQQPHVGEDGADCGDEVDFVPDKKAVFCQQGRAAAGGASIPN